MTAVENGEDMMTPAQRAKAKASLKQVAEAQGMADADLEGAQELAPGQGLPAGVSDDEIDEALGDLDKN